MQSVSSRFELVSPCPYPTTITITPRSPPWYLDIMEDNTIKQVEMKEEIKKEYFRRTRIETKLYRRNLIKDINTSAVPLVRYSGPFLTWTREELKQMDQRTRKRMTMYKALHLRDDVDRKEGEEDLPVLKTVLSHQHNAVKTYKSVEEDWLQPPEINRKQKNGKKNNSVDVLSD